jgi:hypothetical protein
MYREVEARKFQEGDCILQQGQSFGQHVLVIIKGRVAITSSSLQTHGLLLHNKI